MTLEAPPRLTLGDAARIIRAAVRDKSYQATPIGLAVRRYLRWKRHEWGAQPETIRGYEIVLSRLALDHADLELRDLEPPIGTERIREMLARHWPDAAVGSRRKNLSVLSDFFKWAIREGELGGNPTTPIARPKRRDVRRGVIPRPVIERILRAATRDRDRVAILLMTDLALRKAEVRGLQLRDYDGARLLVHGKGGKIREVPIGDPTLRALMDTHWRDRLSKGSLEEYLLYPEHYGPRRDPDAPSMSLIWDLRTRRLSSTAMHHWWKRRLEAAGVPHRPMHEARHTAITDLIRSSGGNLALAQMLAGHASIQTTLDVYGHLTTSDLEAALRELAEKGRG